MSGNGPYLDTSALASDSRAVNIGYFGSATIVLLSDGENLSDPDPVNVAGVSSVAGVRIQTIGVGTEAGTVVQINGFNVATALNSDLLKQVAETANVPPETQIIHEQALFELGRLCLRDTKFTDAEARFKKQLSLYPNGPYAGYGRLWLVCSLLQQARGKDNAKQAGVQEVAERTLRVLKRTVPAALPGVVFLSGGQTDENATAHLDAMNRMGAPWPLTFSYSRALQAVALKAWRGQAGNVAAAQKAFHHRARMNSLAAKGQWNGNLEKQAA